MCDQSIITITGIDHNTFVYLLRTFKPLYYRNKPFAKDGFIKNLPLRHVKRGRPRLLDAEKCLGFLLTWHTTRGSTYVLNILFGVTESFFNIFIRFTRRILAHILSQDDDSRVRIPKAEEYEKYRNNISDKYPSLSITFGSADGLKLYLEQAGDTVIQNMFCNGWKRNHYVSNVILFVPSGLISAAVFNAPGCMHDSQLSEWGGLYKNRESFNEEHGGTIVVDSAFDKGKHPFLIKSAQDETTAEGPEEINMILQATSLPKSSEWGMRIFQGSFPRMKDLFIYEQKVELNLMILMTILLINIRTKLVGLNQIQGFFMPHLSVEERYFLHDHFLI